MKRNIFHLPDNSTIVAQFWSILRNKALSALVMSSIISPILLSFACPALASERGPGKIQDLQIDSGKVVFWVGGPVTNMPACVEWDRMMFDATTPAGQAMLAYLLSAQAIGKQIRVYGTGECSLGVNHETVRSVRDAP